MLRLFLILSLFVIPSLLVAEPPVEDDHHFKTDMIPRFQWVLGAHHKTGTVLFYTLLDRIYTHSLGDHTVNIVTFSELEWESVNDNTSLIILWHAHVQRVPMQLPDTNAFRYVHAMRNPFNTIVSGYLYHLKNNEAWVDDHRCHPDSCPGEYYRVSKKNVLRMTYQGILPTNYRLKTALQLYGCPQDSLSYYRCIKKARPDHGIWIEARRAEAEIMQMMDVYAQTKIHPSFMHICMEVYERDPYQTIETLFSFLGVAHTSVVSEYRTANWFKRYRPKHFHGRDNASPSKSHNARRILHEMEEHRNKNLPRKAHQHTTRHEAQRLPLLQKVMNENVAILNNASREYYFLRRASEIIECPLS